MINQLKNNKLIVVFLFIVFTQLSIIANAQKENLTQIWPAKWIQAQSGSPKDYAVFHFRKTFVLDTIPDRLIIHTSGDTRYQLYVNGQLVTWGPLTGDLRHWYYETSDIKSYLKIGKNLIAAVVQNYGSHPPDARLTVQTGFLLTADDEKFQFLNTNSSWKAIHNTAYSPNFIDKSQINGYYGGGSREIINGANYVWNWQSLSLNDSLWQNAQEIETAFSKSCIWASRWKLTPRTLPHETLSPNRLKAVLKAENIIIPDKFPAEKADIKVSANTKARFVIDNGCETTAYPYLIVSSGKDAVVKITYSEAAYIGDPKNNQKGNRNDINGKTFIGYFDKIIADGGENRMYCPLWWRAFRFLVVDIETKESPLIIHDLYTVRSIYPFEKKSEFAISKKFNPAENDTIQKIFDIGIRTIKLCSHETFIDCPYYEESQFQGDTRVAAMVSYFNFGDYRLGKNAIEQFSWSINDEGFLSARYPTNSFYYIPNFSIYWIGMLYDYMMYADDKEFVRSKLQIMKSILNYFSERQRPDGTVRKPDYHNFIDWSFPKGEPPFDKNGYSAIVDLHFLKALQWAEKIEQYVGDQKIAKGYSVKANQLKSVIRKLYWKPDLELFTDIPNGNKISQHTNCMAILTEVSTGKEAQQVMQKVLENENMTQATLYWKFYLNEALVKASMGNYYLKSLDTWKKLLLVNVTTWTETGDRGRSECHAWGSSPNYHFFKIIAGIDSDAPGFKKIKIEPNFNETDTIKAKVPYRTGEIKVFLYKNTNATVSGVVEIPDSTKAYIMLHGKKISLHAGNNYIMNK
ncbi:MAG: hypothetical protein GZ091_02745 [Paludibacter sp.]|nr:hypothetical protein [Paludibacter sp.]